MPKKDSPKRCFDTVVSALLLVILSPVVLVIAMLVWIVMGSPVLFRQWRSGYLVRPFVQVKFRTMREAKHQNAASLPDADRLTPLTNRA